MECCRKLRWSRWSTSTPELLVPFLALFVTIFSSVAVVSVTAMGSSPMRSVPDLENAMYQSLQGYPCVRLLNVTGELGCANPGRTKAIAPIQRFQDANSVQLSAPRTVLLPSSALVGFLKRLEEADGSSSSLEQQVAGLLIEYDNLSFPEVAGFSADSIFPQAEFAPYDTKSYQWNPTGSGIMYRRLNFPVFLLHKNSTDDVQALAAKNERVGFKYPLNVAEFNAVMRTTKAGTHTTESCLRENSCLPLGGYSVWSALPAMNVSSPTGKPIVLAIASMDSSSFFHDVAPGADSPLSGMLALLAAVDALAEMGGLETLKKQLVFLVLTGESFGYLGSRQFLAQLKSDSNFVMGLNATSIYQVLEVGSIGQAYDSTFYVHKQASAATTPTLQILNALKAAAVSLKDSTSKPQVKPASPSNPGIPPSSLMSFVHKDPTTAGVVLEEFDTIFKNKFYHSQYDDASNINVEVIASAASLVARALYMLASDNTADTTILKSIQVNVSLVEAMVGCLFHQEPGMTCELVKSLMRPSQGFTTHYVGVFQGEPSAIPDPYYIGDTSRFVWNFLADRTELNRKEWKKFPAQNEECTDACKNPEEVCVASTADHKGRCIVSTTRYVPAFSPRLGYDESSGWQLLPLETGDTMGAADPVYTESYWSTIGLQVYLQESSWFDEMVLFLGVSITAFSFFAIICTKAVFQKRLKRA